MNFKDKVAIVTGARGKGIGRATAMALAKAGASVVLAGYRDESILKVKSEIEALDGKVIAVKANMASWSDTQNMATEALKAYGHIDMLVNNAGVEKIDTSGKRFFGT